MGKLGRWGRGEKWRKIKVKMKCGKMWWGCSGEMEEVYGKAEWLVRVFGRCWGVQRWEEKAMALLEN
jgi:hypothetical protein